MNDDPLMYTIRAALRYNDAVSRYITELTCDDSDDIAMSKQEIQLRTMRSVSNRLVFYKTVNPDLIVHDIYTKKTSMSMKSIVYHGQNCVSVSTPSQ